ncbi:YqiA/YcfP family alpha/beta fold hydrolase [Flammeovirga agarivorans]|uniref:Alpha/beta hydrolase n=1 Tax=Flammeovirga agarivorans TaxID=2726742 RepID=A0A7X8XW24_9BACT|nr:YqiA/YcfP family alpha/beta fold hydrolase [Flammeovirga agarivorans]NLR91670.1 alpha/beta hydrolase [Flammeovirga agarivorans]
MKFILSLVLCLNFTLAWCNDTPNQRVLFFLHQRFLEDHGLHEEHPEYGKPEYKEIIAKFKESGFTVISEKRPNNTNPYDYARKVVAQIDKLIEEGRPAKNITIVGTSKGGYIAQYVSTYAQNPQLNFVFVACFTNEDLETLPDINYCGNILTIYEKTDPYGESAIARVKTSNCTVHHFKEIELTTGLSHGFLFKALNDWLDPVIKWANGNYK